MRVAYVDTSCLLAVAFGEPGSDRLAARIEQCDDLYSSNLLEAEFRAAFARERREPDETLLERLKWIVPPRPLSPEIRRVVDVGYLRGSDLWHLATALYLAELPSELPFLTLDERQRKIADALGFPG